MIEQGQLPDPLTPPDCDLRGMPFMQVDIIRLLDSDLFALANGDEFRAAFTLWCKSWHQVPAGSLPDDDRILAHLSGERDRWRDMRDMSLKGWIKCSDGRLYHPVVCEKALEALPQRKEFKQKKSAEASRKERERKDRADLFEALKGIGITPEFNIKTKELRELASRHNVTVGHSDQSVTGHNHVTAIERERERDSIPFPNGKGATEENSGELPLPDPDKAFWDSAKSYLGKSSGGLIGKWCRDYGQEETAKAITAAQVSRAVEPKSYIEKTLRQSRSNGGEGGFNGLC
ncbi:YdaU family protein [Sphingopyxis sp. PET50]|uniref:YdaU family protein n=1 Tax=Sphingopyxis sp. PET50 TaxID=2976533 RepID=UPI0021AFD556|nr:YdaU family protein [Sphingopyxis sp. PET50]